MDKTLELSSSLLSFAPKTGFQYLKQGANKIVDTAANCLLAINSLTSSSNSTTSGIFYSLM